MIDELLHALPTLLQTLVICFLLYVMHGLKRRLADARHENIRLEHELIRASLDAVSARADALQAAIRQRATVNVANLRTLYEDDPVILALLDAIDPDRPTEDSDAAGP